MAIDEFFTKRSQKVEYKYLAYISYCSQDEKWAKWVQHELEQYTVPEPFARKRGSNRLVPIFCGVNDLSGGVLTDVLNQALDSSEYLVVICSPQAAHSRWVNNEVKHFMQTHDIQSIIPVIVDGERPLCFPDALRHTRAAEVWVIDAKNTGKIAAITKIVAIILGISFEKLWDRHQRGRLSAFISRIKKWFNRIITSIHPPKQDYIEKYKPKLDDTKIFISYRRDDGQGAARAIQQALISKYGEEIVFFDFTSLEDEKFNLQILDAIYSCNDFLLVLSPKSMKRCSRKTDWVALEIRTAIKYKKHIIPLNIDNKFHGWPRRFPKDLDELKYEQQLDYQMGTYFGASLDRLLKRMITKPSSRESSQATDSTADFEQRILSSVSDTINKALEGNLSQRKLLYKIRTNKKCVLFIDAVENCTIEPNTLVKISLDRGQYLISFLEETGEPLLEKKLDIECDMFDDLLL